MRRLMVLVCGLVLIFFCCCTTSKKKDQVEALSSEAGDSLVAVKRYGKWGYVNLKGDYVINGCYDDAYAFHEGLAVVKCTNGFYGYINTRGEQVLPAIYHKATGFYDGRAYVVTSDKRLECIDTTGKVQFALNPNFIVSTFSDGLSLYYDDEHDEHGYLNRSGRVMFVNHCDRSTPFCHGLAINESDERSAFINTRGKVEFYAPSREVGLFDDGELAYFKQNGKFGFINRSGDVVIEAQFDQVSDFSEGMAVFVKDDYCGALNRAGEVVVEPKYFDMNGFHEGVAFVKVDDLYGFINAQGVMVIAPQFDQVSDFGHHYACVRQGDVWGFIDHDGNLLAHPQYEDIRFPVANEASLIEVIYVADDE